MPDLIFICNSKALARVAIAIFHSQVAHQLNCFACSCAALKGNCLQLFNNKQTVVVSEFSTTTYGCFSYGQLLFVHSRITDIKICVCFIYLGDLSLNNNISQVPRCFGMHSTPQYFSCCTGIVFLMRNNIQPGTIIAITAMAGYHRAVCSGFFTNHNTCT